VLVGEAIGNEIALTGLLFFAMADQILHGSLGVADHGNSRALYKAVVPLFGSQR